MPDSLWFSHPIDDDDDDFAFDTSFADLTLELREYSADDDDEFDLDERAGLIIAVPPPVPPVLRRPPLATLPPDPAPPAAKRTRAKRAR